MNCRNFSVTQLNNSRSKNSRLTKVLRIFVIHIMDCKNHFLRIRRLIKPTKSNTNTKDKLKFKVLIRDQKQSSRFSKPTTSNFKGKLLKDKCIRDHKRSIRISKPTTSNTKGKLLKVKVLIRNHKRSRSFSESTTQSIITITLPSCECLNHSKLLTSTQVDFQITILIRIACKTK